MIKTKNEDLLIKKTNFDSLNENKRNKSDKNENDENLTEDESTQEEDYDDESIEWSPDQIAEVFKRIARNDLNFTEKYVRVRNPSPDPESPAESKEEKKATEEKVKNDKKNEEKKQTTKENLKIDKFDPAAEFDFEESKKIVTPRRIHKDVSKNLRSNQRKVAQFDKIMNDFLKTQKQEDLLVNQRTSTPRKASPSQLKSLKITSSTQSSITSNSVSISTPTSSYFGGNKVPPSLSSQVSSIITSTSFSDSVQSLVAIGDNTKILSINNSQQTKLNRENNLSSQSTSLSSGSSGFPPSKQTSHPPLPSHLQPPKPSSPPLNQFTFSSTSPTNSSNSPLVSSSSSVKSNKLNNPKSTPSLSFVDNNNLDNKNLNSNLQTSSINKNNSIKINIPTDSNHNFTTDKKHKLSDDEELKETDFKKLS